MLGGRPTGTRVRSPLAWAAPVEDNETGEAGRQSLERMVSELPGRNASEPIGGGE